MANIQGQKKWSPIRLLETHELARGGVDGNLNEQAIALANRTEFLMEEKASKSEIVQGVFEFSTYAEFDAVKSTLPANCTVVIGEENTTGSGQWGIGNNSWNGSILRKSSFDPVYHAKNYTDRLVAESVYSPMFKSIDGITTVNDYIIDSDINHTALKAYPGGQYIKIPVKAGDQIKIEGSRNESTWKLSYIDASGNRISVSENYGDGLYIVPAGAVFALKTVKSTISENIATSYLVYDALANNRVDLLNESLNKLNVSVYTPGFKPIEGIITVNDYIIDSNINNAVLKPYTGGQYIKIPVKAGDQIKIEGSRNESTWRLNYINASGNRISVSENYGDGLYIVPAGAVFALKTVKSSISENTATSYLIYDPHLKNRIDVIDKDLSKLKGGYSIVQVELEPILGAVVNTNPRNPILLVSGVDRTYLQIDVSNYSRMEIKNAREDVPEWTWVFVDSQLKRISITTTAGNGSLEVPDGAKYALRTIRSGGIIENGRLEVYGYATLSINAVYQELKSDIEALQIPSVFGASSNFGEMADMMSEMFKNGNVLKISEFSAPTQHEQIDTAIRFIKKRGWGILDMESGVWLRNSAVLLPDNCWIYLNEATVKLANGVFDNVFRNEGIVPNPDPFEYALELNENRNIRIFGKNKSVSLISGPDVPYTAPHPTKGGNPIPWVGDFYGWRTLPVLLANVKDYKLHDFFMEKTTCWAISQEHGCENFEVYNIGFHTTVKNGDGVDVRQGCKKGKIYNITGFTGDDMVALSAIQNFIAQHPSGNYIYPMQVGGYGDRGFGGNIEDVQINSISGRGLHNGVRLLASGGSKLKKISVDNISDKDDTFNGAIVLVSSGYGAAAQMGDITNITVNGIESNFSQTPLNVSGPIKDSSFNKIRQKKSTGVLYKNTATFDNTEITNAEYVV